MNTRLLLNLALLALVAGLAAVAFLEPGVEEPKSVHLTDLDESTVDRILLENKEAIAFQKREGHWWLTSPFSAPANEIRVRQLLDIGKVESEARYPLNTEDHGKFELDKPKATLTLGSVKLVFGGSDPIDMRRYVWVGETLHLVNDDFSHYLAAPATDFVDKKLLPEDAKPNEIFLPGLKATLGANAQWALEPPGDAASGMSDLLNAWQSARAIDVKRMEQPPQGDIVRIGFSDHAPVEFVILQREPDLLLARVDWGLLYQLPGESAKQLLSLQKPETKPVGQKQEEEQTDSSADEDTEEPVLEEEMESEGEDVEEQE